MILPAVHSLNLQALLARGGSKLLDRRVDGDLLAEHVGDDVGHGTAGPLTRKVDGLALVLDDLGVADGLVSRLNDTLGERFMPSRSEKAR